MQPAPASENRVIGCFPTDGYIVCRVRSGIQHKEGKIKAAIPQPEEKTFVTMTVHDAKTLAGERTEGFFGPDPRRC